MDIIDLTEEDLPYSSVISVQNEIRNQLNERPQNDGQHVILRKLEDIFCNAEWNEAERLSLEFVKQMIAEEGYRSLPEENTNKRKREEEEEEEEREEIGIQGGSDDEMIAKLLQAEYDNEEEEEKKKKARRDEDESIMHYENRDAIEYVCQSVMRTNDSDRQSVMNKLKCGETELDRIISYLIACPKIIHFHPDRVMEYFVEDDQYRNQFETNTSSGALSASSRRSWERNLFGSSYSDESTGIRPKYGVLMYNGYDMKGCPSARTHYGDSYLVLQNVEDRVTYCYGDSGGHGSRSNATDVLGYGCWLARILNTMPLPELQFLYRMSHPSFVPPEDMIPSQRSTHSTAQRLGCYIEIQVHGSVLFHRDVSMICLASRWKSDPRVSKFVGQFCEINPGIYLNYIDD